MRRRPRQDRVVITVYMVGLYMSIVDSTIVNTALPSITREFHTTLASTEWVVIGYLLSLAVAIPSSGWIGDRFGTKISYLGALLLFTVASALCGLAPRLSDLIILRIVQGVGGGLLAPVGQAMLFRTYPAAQRARASGIVALGSSLGPAVGPILGGILVTELSWRWCFYVNVPFGVTALAIGVLFLDEHREPAAGRFDGAGFLLAGAGMALFLYAVSEAPTLGWADTTIIVTATAGVVGLVALVVVELRRRDPMLNLRLLGNRIFRTSIVVSLFSSSAYSGYLFVMPQFLQEARGASALSSGLTTFPGALGLLVNSPISAKVYPRVGPRRMALLGLCGVAVIFSLMSLVSLTTSAWLIRLLAFCSGSSIAWTNIPLQAGSFATISSGSTGRASALFNTQNRVAGGLGVAILATVVSASVHLGPSTTGATLVGAYHHALLAAAGLVLISALIATRIHDSDAAATMRPVAATPTTAPPVPTTAPLAPTTAPPARTTAPPARTDSPGVPCRPDTALPRGAPEQG